MSKLTKASKGMDCIRCGAPEAYSAHYNGQRQFMYGKGRGIKANDLATAELCHNCDQIFSEGKVDHWESEDERSEEFLHLIMMTNIRRLENGVIKV